MFQSKIQAIKVLSKYMELAEAKAFVEAVMELGAEDWKRTEFVKAQLALIEKLNSEGE